MCNSAGEGRLAVALTPDHAFVDQLLAQGRDGCGPDPERGRNVAGWVRTRSEFRHRPKIFLLELGQTVEANAKEVGIQMGDDAGRGFLNVGALDRALGKRVSDVEAPFLNEIKDSAPSRAGFLRPHRPEIQRFGSPPGARAQRGRR